MFLFKKLIIWFFIFSPLMGILLYISCEGPGMGCDVFIPPLFLSTYLFQYLYDIVTLHFLANLTYNLQLSSYCDQYFRSNLELQIGVLRGLVSIVIVWFLAAYLIKLLRNWIKKFSRNN